VTRAGRAYPARQEGDEVSVKQDRQAHWQQVYETRASDAVSWYQPVPRPSADLLQRAGATPGSVVVDIGGGASTLVDWLIDNGFRDVTVLDLSDAALAAARKRLGAASSGVSWIAADVTKWRPARLYDIWHDRAAFHFLTDPGDRAAYLDRLRAGLRPGGHAIIGTFAPDGPEKCSGLPVERFDAEKLAATLGEGFRLVDSCRHEHVTPSGAVQRFHFGTFRRED
jgi:SAM-dependent methyltransferase